MGAGEQDKKSKTNDEPDLNVEEKLALALGRMEALEREATLAAENAHRAVTSRDELRARVLAYHKDFEAERTERADIVADMTRQYKAMQDELLGRITALEGQVVDVSSQLELAHVALAETKREKDGIIAAKDAVIAEQKTKMEEMAVEFGDMLKETLDKMSERIELANNDWDPAIEQQLADKLGEFNAVQE